MTDTVKTFDFDIHPIPLIVPGNLLPGGKAEVTFQVCNASNRPVRAEVMIVPLAAPNNAEGNPPQPQEWASWLKLDQPPEYDYETQSVREYKVKIQVPEIVTPGRYTFTLLLVGLDDPDHEYLESIPPVSFSVALPAFNSRPLMYGMIGLLALALIVAGFFIIRSSLRPGLTINLESLGGTVLAGQPTAYTLTLKNIHPTPIRNVVVEYTYPEVVKGAWAKVDRSEPIMAQMAYCGSVDDADNRLLRCALGEIASQETVTLTISILPGSPVKGTGDSLAPTPVLTPIPVRGVLIEPVVQPGSFSVHWVEKRGQKSRLQSQVINARAATVEDKSSDGTIFGAAIPGVDVATVGQPVKISLAGWIKGDKDVVALKYQLPTTVRFAYIPATCWQDNGDYFTLYCSEKDKGKNTGKFDIWVIPLQDSTGFDQNLQGGKWSIVKDDNSKYQDLITEAKKRPSLPAVYNQLVFNGKDEWAQLGYIGQPVQTPSAGLSPTVNPTPIPSVTPNTASSTAATQVPPAAPTTVPPVSSTTSTSSAETTPQAQMFTLPRTFTAEMWVNPLSLVDGQAFLGAHRQNAGTGAVTNAFLVGYYNNAIDINVMGDFHHLSLPKTSAPFHLAVVVDSVALGDKYGQPRVTAYVNGCPQFWSATPEAPECQFANQSYLAEDNFSRRFSLTYNNKIEDPTDGKTSLNWVIGQEWDAEGSRVIPSDFFHGSVNDVRLWEGVRTPLQVKEDMSLPPAPPCKDDKDANCSEQKLLGWWPLTPTAGSAASANCSLAMKGRVDTLASGQKNTACVLVDFGPGQYNGARSGGAWIAAGPRFGNALVFDGHNALNQNDPNVSIAASIDKQLTQPVRVTMAAWVFVDAVPSTSQWILGEKPLSSISLNTWKTTPSFFGMMIDNGGYVSAVIGGYRTSSPANDLVAMRKDDNPIPVGRWVHFAMGFVVDEKGEIAPNTLQLLRDGYPVKRDVEPNAEKQSNLKTGIFNDLRTKANEGFSLGGIKIGDTPGYSYRGRIDEVRAWVLPTDIKLDMNFWRRQPGMFLNELLYWPFDDDLGRTTNSKCLPGYACDPRDPTLSILIDGPAWIPSDLSIDYTSEPAQ